MKMVLVSLSIILLVSQLCYCNVLNFNHPPYAEDNEQIESQQQEHIKQVRWQEQVLEDINDISTTKEELLIAIPSRSQDSTFTSLKTNDQVHEKSVAEIPVLVLNNNPPEIQRSDKSLEPTPEDVSQKRTRKIKRRRRPQKVKENSNVDGQQDILKQISTPDSTIIGQLGSTNVDSSNVKATQYSRAYTEITRVKAASTEIPTIIDKTTHNLEFDSKPTPTENLINHSSKPNTVNRGLRRHRIKVSTEIKYTQNTPTKVVDDDINVKRTSILRRVPNRRRNRPDVPIVEKTETLEIPSTTKSPQIKTNPSENSHIEAKSSTINPDTEKDDTNIPVIETTTSRLNSQDASTTVNLNYKNTQSLYETPKFEPTQTPIQTVPQSLLQNRYNVHYTVELPETNPVDNSYKESVSSFESNTFKNNQLIRYRGQSLNAGPQLSLNNNDNIRRDNGNIAEQQNQNIDKVQSRFREGPTPIVQLAKEDSRQTIRSRQHVQIAEQQYQNIGKVQSRFNEDATPIVQLAEEDSRQTIRSRQPVQIAEQQYQNIGKVQSRFKEDATPIVQLVEEDSRQTIRSRQPVQIAEQQYQNIGKAQSRFKEDATPIVQLAEEDSRQTIRTRNPVKIIESQSYVFGDTGDFHYSFEDEDGTKKFENGKLKQFDDDITGESVRGGYSYKDKEGKEYSLSYTADENGYRPVGDHLPTPPPIPPYIARALQYLATKTTPEPVTQSSN